jgi:AraC family transcriptional regulator
LIDIRQSFVSTDQLNVALSSRDLRWDNVRVDEMDIAANSEIALPPQSFHFIAIVLGGVTDVAQRRGSKEYRSKLRAGSIMVVPSGVESYFNSSRDHRTCKADLPVKLLTSAAEELGMRGSSPELMSVFECRDSSISHFISIFLEELRKPVHPAQAMIVDATSIAFAAYLLRKFDSRTEKLPKGPASLTRRQLTDVLEYCENRLGETIHLAELAAIAGVSRFHFARLFKASTGVSPMANLERLRLDRAQALIRTGALRLSEVALATGFADQSHFTRRFRLHAGMTPGKYEREYGHPTRHSTPPRP